MAKPVIEPVFKQWYRKMIVDDVEDIGHIAIASAERLKTELLIPLDPDMTIAVYCGTLEAFIAYLKKKQSEFPEFWFNVFDTLEVGYDTLENDEDEKTGNYNIKVFYLEDAPRIVTDSSLSSPDEIITKWAALNVNTDTDFLVKDIFAYVKEYLMSNLNITVERPETLLVMFLMINEELIKTVKMKRIELNTSDFFITIAGLFEVHCRDTEQGERVMFKTEPSPKQFIKDDGSATTKLE